MLGVRSAFCEVAKAVRGMQRENDQLKAENAKLREDLEDQEGYDQMLRDRLRQQTELRVKAEAENVKLRELVAEMWLDSVIQRMRELGVDE